MEIKTDQVADVIVLRLKGDLNARADITAVFWAQLQNGHSKFILNFAHILTINSTGFTALLELQHLAEASGGSVRICGLDEKLRKLFKSYGMDQTFSIMRDENTALVGFIGALPVHCGDACQSKYLN